MKQFFDSLKIFMDRILGRFFSTTLPVGLPAFEAFSSSVLKTYDIPELPSYHQAVASMVMHLGPTQTKVKKFWLAKCIHKAMANEVAFNLIQKIKLEEKAKNEAVPSGPEKN